MRKTTAIRFALLGLLAGATSLLAGAQGRVHGKVVDENGNPVPGVKITITDPDVKGRVIETVSDELGKYQLVIVDATKVLPWKIEKQGFHTTQTPKKVPAATTTELDLTVYSLGVALPKGEMPSAEDLDAAKAKAEAATKSVESFNAGAKLYKAADLDGALAQFEQAVAYDPTLARAYAAMAMIRHEKKQWAEAGAAADRAAELNPADATNQQVRFDAYSRLGDREKLATALEGLKAADPKGAAQFLYQRGETMFNAGDSAGAESVLAEAVTLDPTNARAHYRYGLCLVNLNKTAQAKAELQKFLELAPQDPEAPGAKEMLSYLK